MLHRQVCGQQDGQYKVGGVTGGGQHPLPLTGLVHGALVTVDGHVNVILLGGLEPDHRHCIVQDFRVLLCQDAPERWEIQLLIINISYNDSVMERYM